MRPRLLAAGCAKTVTPCGRLDEADRLEGVGLVLLHVRAAAVGQPVLGERVADGRDDAEFDERGGEVGAADGAVACDTGHLVPGDGDTEVVEPGDHGLGAGNAVVAHELALGEQRGLLRVEEVGQHVHADAADAAGELRAGHEGEAARQGGEGLGVAAGGVVVGERDDVQSGGGRVADECGGGVRAVGGGGVGVQVDAHEVLLRAGGTAGDAQG